MDNRLPARFWSKVLVNPDTRCWEWQATKNHKGYGQFWHGGQMTGAHRVSYEALCAPLTKGKVLDHKCEVKYCVNPSHLEEVTSRENTFRSDTPARRNARKTHCKNGHEFSESNTYIGQSRGTPIRQCRACRRKATKESVSL